MTEEEKRKLEAERKKAAAPPPEKESLPANEVKFASVEAVEKLTIELAAEKKKNRRLEIAGRLEKVETITPAQREGLIDFALAIDSDEEAEYNFAAADGKTEQRKIKPVDFFFSWLERMPKIDLGTHIAGADTAPGAPKSESFAFAKGETADEERLAEHEAAVTLAAERKIEYSEAMLLVEQGVKPGSSAPPPPAAPPVG